MRKLIQVFILGVFALSATELHASFDNEEMCLDEETMVFPCFLTQTDPSDGNCPAQYTFYGAIANTYLWTVSGSAYFSSATNNQQASVIPQRSFTETRSFTISLYRNGVFACSSTYTVLPEGSCQ